MRSSFFWIVAVIPCLLSGPVVGQNPLGPSRAQQPATMTAQAVPPAGASSSCKAQATDKKLAGAALTSFMKKCESDASKACDVQAGEKKLAGAAKTSFTKKCVSDAVGT
jgi:hypothetical protein